MTAHSGLKVGIIHYRTGRTDGVSLEMEKRGRILSDLGCEVRFVAGPVSEKCDFVIDDLEFDSPQIAEIKENCFSHFQRDSLRPAHLLDRIHRVAARIKGAFLEYHASQRFDALLVHNVFSHGRHIAAASAFYGVLGQLKIPVVATHHDYYWERPEYERVTHPLVQDYLNEFVPPVLPGLMHVSINSIAASQLKLRRGISSTVVPDVWDFDQPRWKMDAYNSHLLPQIGVDPGDLVVLQATRIVARKGIELAIDFVAGLARQKERLVGRKLYNGKILTADSRIVLILAGYAEKSALPYLEALRQEADRSGIEVRFISNHIGATRRAGTPKVFSLWDAYTIADVVTYPSLVEGWGNQFIEAVFARKPVVLFEYPVFRQDIRCEGYRFVSLGDEVTSRGRHGLIALPPEALDRAVDSMIRFLTEPKAALDLDRNASIGAKHHGFPVMRDFLLHALPIPFAQPPIRLDK